VGGKRGGGGVRQRSIHTLVFTYKYPPYNFTRVINIYILFAVFGVGLWVMCIFPFIYATALSVLHF
jgi:hypothetical protein